MRNKFITFYIFALCIPVVCNAATPLAPDIAIANVRNNCGTISDTFKSMKRISQVNTAVTSVGTASGAGALIAGIVKAKTDAKQTLQNINTNLPGSALNPQNKQNLINNVNEEARQNQRESKQTPEQKSKTLGNIRTGLLAGNTATNIAGTIIATTNQTDDDLRTQLDKCTKSLSDLQVSRIQARADGADNYVLNKMDNVISACRDFNDLDISSIDNKAKGAAISSGIGAGVGLAGTITSATANSDKIRKDNTEPGIAKEQNLNTASNVLAAGATAASGIATVFNAQQIGTLKRAYEIAHKCSEELNK